MASSGSFSGSIVSGHYKLRVDWSQSKNVSANTSTITCKMYLVNDWSLSIGSRSNTCTINGHGSGLFVFSYIDHGNALAWHGIKHGEPQQRWYEIYHHQGGF